MKGAVPVQKPMEDYRSAWWLTTVGSWIVTTVLALGIFGWAPTPTGVRDSTFFAGLDALHHVGFLSPFVALALARRAVRRALPSTPPTQWFLTGVAPFWCIGVIFASLFMTLLAAAIGSDLDYGWYLLLPLFLIARLALEIFWFWLCFRDAPRVAVLEKTDDPAPGKAFRLKPLDGPIQYVVVRECDDVSSSVYLMEGDSEVLWKAVGSIEDLAIAVHTSAAGKAGKKQGI